MLASSILIKKICRYWAHRKDSWVSSEELDEEIRHHLFGLGIEVALCAEWIARYREAAVKQHNRFFQAWQKKEHEIALVELHFFLNCLVCILDFMRIIGNSIGDEVKAYVDSDTFPDHRDARNHFEHIEDRLYGSKRNAPKEVFDEANPRTIHFGLKGSEQTFQFGDQSIDVSKAFLKKFLEFIDELIPILMTK